MKTRSALSALAVAMLIAGCSSTPPKIPPVAQVDVPRFMGDWYVIAHIPSFPERNAYDAVESYALRADGKIQTTFRYRNGSFSAPLKTMRPLGTVEKHGNGAVWNMQFVWPIQAEYVIAWLDPDYTQTIIGRSKRDYVWLMARTPRISAADHAAAMQRIAALGYDLSKVRRVPQSATRPTPPDRRAEQGTPGQATAPATRL